MKDLKYALVNTHKHTCFSGRITKLLYGIVQNR